MEHPYSFLSEQHKENSQNLTKYTSSLLTSTSCNDIFWIEMNICPQMQ